MTASFDNYPIFVVSMTTPNNGIDLNREPTGHFVIDLLTTPHEGIKDVDTRCLLHFSASYALCLVDVMKLYGNVLFAEQQSRRAQDT